MYSITCIKVTICYIITPLDWIRLAQAHLSTREYYLTLNLVGALTDQVFFSGINEGEGGGIM